MPVPNDKISPCLDALNKFHEWTSSLKIVENYKTIVLAATKRSQDNVQDSHFYAESLKC